MQDEEECQRLRELGTRFWEEEWCWIRDFMMIISDEKCVEEIEDRILVEYGELFRLRSQAKP